jgi:hypothetical protein
MGVLSSLHAFLSTSASSTLWQLYLQFEVKLCQRKVLIIEQTRTRVQSDASIKESLKETMKSEQRQCRAALTRAKAVFYRAIQSVPYCKGEHRVCTDNDVILPSSPLVALYMTAFTPPLRQIFPLDELLRLSQVMQERHLRLYTDLTAFITPANKSSDIYPATRAYP